MAETKTQEWRRLCAEYPDMSPFVLLKISMVWHGARLSGRALERLQEPDYRFASDEPFEIAFTGRTAQGRERRLVMPGGVLLRDATYVYINWGETYEDPYVIDYDEALDEFTLREPAAGPIAADGDDAPGVAREGLVDVIGFTPRPALYDFTTSAGTPADALADARAQKLILTAYRRCEFWREGNQCRFCALFTRRGVDPVVPCDEISQVVRTALAEPGRYSQLYISGGSDMDGTPAFSHEQVRYVAALRAMGESFSGRFACQLMAPAYDEDALARIVAETGVTSYSPNLEVWGAAQFARLCPGKQAHVGYDEWLRRTAAAVGVLGRGNVYTQLVGGAELAGEDAVASVDDALARDVEACEWFAERGVTCLSVIWRPHRRSVLGWRPMPPIDYYVRLAREFHAVRARHGLVAFEDDYKACGNHPDSDLERCDLAVWQGLAREEITPAVDEAGAMPREACTARVRVPLCSHAIGAVVATAGDLGVAAPSAPAQTLVVSVAEDRSDLGAGLAHALWFDEPIELWLARDGGWEHVVVRAWRCDIVGPVFSAALARARAGHATAEVASAWELRPVSREPVASAPDACAPTRAPRPELHLDNPLLH
uniref:radical SAM protein n=1 Tax=Parolsenella massiliensis TaxID=1871022 RepID=UPI000933DAFE|nr:radical SAM protein [Parolsenella massiliensis]